MIKLWVAFIAGLFIGANVGVMILAMLVANRPCDHHLPDIEDVQTE